MSTGEPAWSPFVVGAATDWMEVPLTVSPSPKQRAVDVEFQWALVENNESTDHTLEPIVIRSGIQPARLVAEWLEGAERLSAERRERFAAFALNSKARTMLELLNRETSLPANRTL
jgi:hypothetical protein